MCFSATASFITAGVTGAVGVLALSRAGAPRELPLATTPILFALQQGIEGALWLAIPPAAPGAAPTGLVLAFLLIAQVLWPVYAPAAVLAIEPAEGRRRWLRACLAAGLAVATVLAWDLLSRPPGAAIVDGHIVYGDGRRHSNLTGLVYLAATGLPLLLSSLRPVVVLGAVVMAGLVVAHEFYWAAFVSVWCFFAAAASVVILGHFERSRRRRLRPA